MSPVCGNDADANTGGDDYVGDDNDTVGDDGVDDAGDRTRRSPLPKSHLSEWI